MPSKGTGDYDLVNTLKTVTVKLTAKKVLTGRDLTDKDVFNFVVLEGNEVVAKGTNNRDGDITFDTITYHEKGVHDYVIKEVKGTDGEKGIYYSDTELKVKVIVTGNNDGTLSTEVISQENMTIENTYKAESTSVVLEATKSIIGKNLTANEFKFEVYENGKVVATGTNDAKGMIKFTSIEYTTVGNHSYIIKEVNGGKTIGRVIYDGSEYNVLVNVVDNGEGQLVATVHYPENGVQFENTYSKLTSLIIYKVDQDHNFLEGADFQLVKEDGTIINPLKGKARFEFNNLTDGNYKVVETVTPEGYEGIGEFNIVISNGFITCPEYDINDPFETLTVENTNDGDEPEVFGDEIDEEDYEDWVLGEEVDDTVKTSDDQNIMGYTGLSLISAVLFFFLRRKKELNS